MVYPWDLEEYLRRYQRFPPSNKQFNYHPGTSTTQAPASVAEQPPLLSTDRPLYGPSMSHASASLDPSWTMHTTIDPSTVNNLYQSNMHSSSAMQYRAGLGVQDYVSPGQTMLRFRSSMSTPSTQETSPPSEREHIIEVADVEATFAHDEPQIQDQPDDPLKCFWRGCRRHDAFSSDASLMRHIRVQHVVHRSVRCPECGQAFGRMDNMKEHRGRRHRKFD